MGTLISKFLGHVVPGVIKPLHSLWNQVIGFLFLVFTVLSVAYVVRAVRDFNGDAEGLMQIALPALFALVMGYFCISSFWRARKISRS
ncbi:MAG: hypothetical protein ABL967_11325 [Bryobacteraceae bacterium]